MAILTSVVTGGSNLHVTSSEDANRFNTNFLSGGIVSKTALVSGAGPFAITAQGTPNNTVTVAAGDAYIQATPTGQGSQVLEVHSTTPVTLTIAANASGSTRWDYVYLAVNATAAANPAIDASDVTSIVVNRSTSATTDTAGAPAFSQKLGVITVTNGFASIVSGNITDARTVATISGVPVAGADGWTSMGANVPATVTYNGNRSYSLVFPAVDLTGSISNGMRLKLTRTVTAPTQCTSLNGTTQFYNKVSPSGMTFTDNFTCMAWIKVSSYQTGVIIGRTNVGSSAGWQMFVSSSGQLTIQGINAGAGDSASSYQSIPLNKWVHVAATMNMAGTLSTMYIDGVSIPVAYTNSAATSVSQSGDLMIGKNADGNFFPGKIAQAAVFSAVLNAATIQSYISQGLAGNETSLISAYSFNNSVNDLNANANNLTANGSAVATNVDSPFTQDDNGTPLGTTDFAIVTSKVFSTNTTLTVQVPEGCAIPTSGGVSAMSYSTQKSPYGFPNSKFRWAIEVLDTIARDCGSNPGSSTWAQPANGLSINVPTGAWDLGYSTAAHFNGTATTGITCLITLSTTTNTSTDLRYITQFGWDYGTSGTMFTRGSGSITRPVNLSSATTYNLLLQYQGGTFTSLGLLGYATIFAVPAAL